MENRLILLAVALLLPGCITIPPVKLSAHYVLPNGKGVVEISTELPRWIPNPEPDPTLFPTGQK